MPKKHIPLCILIAALLPACAPATQDSDNEISILKSSSTADATTTLIGRTGDEIGQAQFFKGNDGVVMRLSINSLTPGLHGMHFHTKGTCEDQTAGFKATGGHVMPLGKPHGFLHPEGPHAGNLPNLVVGSNGTANVELYTNLVTLSEGNAALLDQDGTTLIIHENEDDHLTQPIGGAGGRVACGVIKG